MKVGASLLLVLVGVGALVAACGGGGSKSDPNANQGQAGLAVAQFFRQERDGGVLPQGTRVDFVGTQDIRPLSVSADQKKQSIKARYCVQYRYTMKDSPFTITDRVYIATFKGGTDWSVEAVKPSGNCDDVA